MVVKKIFIISSILLLITLVFSGIYMIAFKPDAVTIVDDVVEKGVEKDIKDLLSEKIGNITSDRVIGYTVSADGKTISYVDAIDGRVWTMTVHGANREAVMSETSGVPSGVAWSDDGTSLITKHADGSVFVHEIAGSEKITLRKGMDDVKWGSTDEKILYKYYDEKTKERTLNIANKDGSQWRKIAVLPFRYTIFEQMPSSIFALYWPRGTANTRTELHSVNTVNDGDDRKIFEGKYGVDYLASPSGDKILMSSLKEDKGITLGMIDSSGENYVDLQVPTIVAKAAWSRDGKYVYYAQPMDIPDNAVMPDDYFSKKITTHDTFYKMEIASGKKERIIELDEITEKLDAIDLQLSEKEDMLFFINRVDGLLYRINI